ncbi:hypothetical protein BDK92_0471 [Micromonospora pisi]|uniref:Uncharacterized protein n=1 Tax=Micromonospora pisi TaxID=589240 RepID=A0A495JBE3_9ACTN|nr:hypothetical protein BDK92_0471 [Micromonospora pisi]
MKVLFLGGPWHDQRHEVTPARAVAAARSLPMYLKVPVTATEGGESADPTSTLPRQSGGHVTYTRRFARGGGERLPVYVAPDYDGPPRA